jgi:galactokinase
MTHRVWFETPTTADEQWERFEELVRGPYSNFFDGLSPIAGARAPGRLDVLGGVADYSGSLVLEMPLACAACAAWQWRSDRLIKVKSVSPDGEELDATLSLDALVKEDGTIKDLAEVKAALSADASSRWAAYVVGCYFVLLKAYTQVTGGKTDEHLGQAGANILIASDVPAGAGVSSSAALEVASMSALCAAAGIEPSDMTLAAWCQRVENEVVGAPCGIMDQVTSALGNHNHLLVLQCQPHTLLGHQKTPTGWKFVGIDSCVKHSVGGGEYTRARVGAFMGLKIIQLESGGKPKGNYLCRLSVEEFNSYKDLIPEKITGSEYANLYGLLPDTITRVVEDEIYYPRSCAEHPVLENERVKRFYAIMEYASNRYEEDLEACTESDVVPHPDRDVMVAAGQLMYAAHESYSNRLNLGSPETDLLVSLVKQYGPEHGLYGAKITGGGAGGTVAVLAEAGLPAADIALEKICDAYQKATGRTPRTFTGSSSGAVQFGPRQIFRG